MSVFICQHARIDGHPRFSITNAKLNAQDNIHMLRVGYELARFCRECMLIEESSHFSNVKKIISDPALGPIFGSSCLPNIRFQTRLKITDPNC